MTAPTRDRSFPPRFSAIVRSIKQHALLLFTLLGLMWTLEILDLLPFVDLDRFGIRPRSASGLIGIVCAPLLHAGFGHLLANSLPFLILGGFVLLGGVRVFWRVTLFVVLISGLGVWLSATTFSNHLGASGLIFGYLGFLLARGFFEKSWPWTLAGCALLFVYGGMLFGVLPLQSGVSWQGHLFGFLAGIGAARWLFSGAGKSFR